jgi:hypothetical protein
MSLNLGQAAGQYQASTTVLQWAIIETRPVVSPRLSIIDAKHTALLAIYPLQC